MQLLFGKSKQCSDYQISQLLKKFFYFWIKSKHIEKLFYYIVAYSYLLLPLSFLIAKKKYKSNIPILLTVYGLVCFVFLFFYWDFSKNLRVNLQSIYTFFEYSVFAYVFYINIKNRVIRNIIVAISVLFFCFQTFYIFYRETSRLDSIPIGIETIVLLFYIIYFFYQFSKELSTTYIYNHYAFWISVGVLIYLGGSFFFFILVDHLSNDQREAFGDLTYVTEMIKNILFSVAIFTVYKYPFQKIKNHQDSIPYLDMI
jgi:hypothetical protein